MRIGYVQMAPAFCNPEKTLNKLQELEDSFRGIDLLVFPELCNSGYNFENIDQAKKYAEELENSEFLHYLQTVCSRNNQFIVTGFNEKDGHDIFNTAILMGPEGYIGKYRKLHLFLNEKTMFQPGNTGLPVFDLGKYKIGILICFDWIFPEAWRILAMKGADIICHPSNLVIPGLAQKAIPVQAVMNRIYIVTCNRIGKEGDLQFTGMSVIANPKSEVLVQGSPDKVEVKGVDIDLELARNKMITPKNHVFLDRRPEEYKSLLE